MDKSTATQLRGNIFRHLDGIAITSTMAALQNKGIIKFIIENKSFTIEDVFENFPSNHGYMNVALRLLSAQGWLTREIDQRNEHIIFTLTERGDYIFSHSHIYTEVAPLLKDVPLYRYKLFSAHDTYSNTYNNSVQIIQSLSDEIPEQIKLQIQGILIGPALVALGMNEKIKEYLNANKFNQNDVKDFPLINSFANYFIHINFLNADYSFTEMGEFYFNRAAAYGVTVSYLPMFSNQDEIFFGDPHHIWKRDETGSETHVDRTMNVWGSGGAHSTYFKKIDEIVINIFNRPLDEQPVGIADMGCGDGTLLKHLYELVKNNTLRGENLAEHPLLIVGADFNQAARIASAKTLTDSRIQHHILHADISHPNKYAAELKSQFDIELGDLLNVRSFLDHNRIYSTPKMSYSHRVTQSSGAYAYRGRLIPNYELKQNLVEHLHAWCPYVKRFGLLVLELHCLPPHLTSDNIGATTSTAYESTHGYSDQYIVEISTFLNAAEEAGLVPEAQNMARFPNSDLATISINLFKSKL
ncbi:MAG: class I SAM-dependent methyltransferase [Candidatus Marinimicrobia bacterium]|nr:class I SAM-dependent methyltransferase [Candidatus Neomarinimicrobiota bacterium]